MNRSITKIGLGLGLTIASLSLAACADDSYRYSVRASGYSGYGNSYNGWYDGYYGSIYDGYWGSDNYFYFRLTDRDRYRRGDRNHFHRGDRAPHPRFKRFEGTTRPPAHGTRMPKYPKQDREHDRRRDRD